MTSSTAPQSQSLTAEAEAIDGNHSSSTKPLDKPRTPAATPAFWSKPKADPAAGAGAGAGACGDDDVTLAKAKGKTLSAAAPSSSSTKRKPAKRIARHFVEEQLQLSPSHYTLLKDSTHELLRGLANLSRSVEDDPLYFDQLLGAAVNMKHAFDLGRMDVINGTIRPRNTSLCHECITTVSSVWRSGPQGPRTLCNACGLRYYKQNQRRALEAKRKEAREATEAATSLAALGMIDACAAKLLMIQKQQQQQQQQDTKKGGTNKRGRTSSGADDDDDDTGAAVRNGKHPVSRTRDTENGSDDSEDDDEGSDDESVDGDNTTNEQGGTADSKQPRYWYGNGNGQDCMQQQASGGGVPQSAGAVQVSLATRSDGANSSCSYLPPANPASFGYNNGGLLASSSSTQQQHQQPQVQRNRETVAQPPLSATSVQPQSQPHSYHQQQQQQQRPLPSLKCSLRNILCDDSPATATTDKGKSSACLPNEEHTAGYHGSSSSAATSYYYQDQYYNSANVSTMYNIGTHPVYSENTHSHLPSSSSSSAYRHHEQQQQRQQQEHPSYSSSSRPYYQ